MSEFTIRTRKFKQNPLLGRKQFVLDIIHPGMANVSKKDLSEKLRSMYKVHDVQCIQLFGFKTAFGGGRSTGFGRGPRKSLQIAQLLHLPIALNAEASNRALAGFEGKLPLQDITLRDVMPFLQLEQGEDLFGAMSGAEMEGDGAPSQSGRALRPREGVCLAALCRGPSGMGHFQGFEQDKSPWRRNLEAMVVIDPRRCPEVSFRRTGHGVSYPATSLPLLSSGTVRGVPSNTFDSMPLVSLSDLVEAPGLDALYDAGDDMLDLDLPPIEDDDEVLPLPFIPLMSPLHDFEGGADIDEPASVPVGDAQGALAPGSEAPLAKRRRKVFFVADEMTEIPNDTYRGYVDDRTGITRKSVLDYTMMLPHYSQQLPLFTTTFTDMCPSLCEGIVNGSEVSEKRRRLAQETEFAGRHQALRQAGGAPSDWALPEPPQPAADGGVPMSSPFSPL
ncbi:unnamed protein product, partial [Polarella glacialis]